MLIPVSNKRKALNVSDWSSKPIFLPPTQRCQCAGRKAATCPDIAFVNFASVNDLLSSFHGKSREPLISSLDGIAHKVINSTPKLKLSCLKPNAVDRMWKRCLTDSCLRAWICEASTAISDPMSASNTQYCGEKSHFPTFLIICS